MKFNEVMAWAMGLGITCGALLPFLFARLIYIWVKQIKKSLQTFR